MDSRIHFVFELLRNPTQRKHVFRWMRSLQKDYLLRFSQPWLVFDVIDILTRLDLNGKRVFEYGSGGSTLFWLQRRATLVSVEHDEKWHELVMARLPPDPAIDYRLIRPGGKPVSDQCEDPADPECYLSADACYRGYSFRNYASQIDTFPSEYFDIVLIDGRARPSCIKHSVAKVKVGGILIVDNADRGYYLSRTRAYLREFREKSFVGAIAAHPTFASTSTFTRRA